MVNSHGWKIPTLNYIFLDVPLEVSKWLGSVGYLTPIHQGKVQPFKGDLIRSVVGLARDH